MHERGLDIRFIGLVFALSPMVFQTLRMAFAIVADRMGWDKLFTLNAVLYPLTGLSFFFSSSVPGFFAGKFLEGVRNASIVAVSRTAALDSSGRNSRVTASLYSFTSIAEAAGKLVTGIVLAFLSLSNALLFFAIASAAMVWPAIKMKGTFIPHAYSKEAKSLNSLDPRTKKPFFQKVFLPIALLGISQALVMDFILPLFLDERGLLFWDVALHIALFSLVSGVVSLLILRGKINIPQSRMVHVQLVVGVSALVVMPFVSRELLAPAIVLLGIADGIVRVVFESLVVGSVTSSHTLSIDLGLLHLPFHYARSIALFSAGFIAVYAGYSGVFILSAIFFLAYSLAIGRLYYEGISKDKRAISRR